MEHIWIELYNPAKAKLNPHKVSEWVEAGGVAAAIEGVSGRIYTGVAWTAPARLASALSATRCFTCSHTGRMHSAASLR